MLMRCMYICIHMLRRRACVPLCTCGGQRTALWNMGSLLPPLCAFCGLNSHCQDCKSKSPFHTAVAALLCGCRDACLPNMHHAQCSWRAPGSGHCCLQLSNTDGVQMLRGEVGVGLFILRNGTAVCHSAPGSELCPHPWTIITHSQPSGLRSLSPATGDC